MILAKFKFVLMMSSVLHYDVIIALSAHAWCTLACLTCELRMETCEVESCIRGYHVFKSIWNPTTREKLNCMQERTNTVDPYAVAVIRRSAVVDHVSRKLSDACALFLRQNHLRLVLFNTRVQSFHKKFGRAHVHNVHVGGTHTAAIHHVYY